MLSDFDFRNNSIGFLRFFFAAVVVWSHAYPLGGFGEDPVAWFSRGAENAGNLSVAGFFLLSGFLITRSYITSRSLGRFLWHRILRIFPAFWVCLIAVALIFAPLAYIHEHGTFAGYWGAENSPLRYIVVNAFLWMLQYNVAGALVHVPFPHSFNGSLWTLRFEFLCYLAVAFFGVTGLLKRSPVWVVLAALALYASYAIPLTFAGTLQGPLAFHALLQGNNRLVPELLIYFFAGSAAYLYRDRIPMRGWIAAVCAVICMVALPFSAYALVLPPALSYAILYIAQKWPPRNFDRHADLSYGLYIYAFPTQQLLALYDVNSLGLMPYFLVAAVITVSLAALSWFFVERPSLSLKHATLASLKASM